MKNETEILKRFENALMKTISKVEGSEVTLSITADTIKEFKEIIELSEHLKVCDICGKEFISKRNDSKYCSNNCAAKAYKRRLETKRPIQNEYNKTSQFYRMRIKRAKTKTEKDKLERKFEKYKINYQKKKEQHSNEKLSKEEFIDWIIKQKR